MGEVGRIRISLKSIDLAPDFGILPDDKEHVENAFLQANNMRDDLRSYVRERDDKIDALTRDLTAKTEECDEWEEREAALCPEDQSIEETVGALRARVAALEAAGQTVISGLNARIDQAPRNAVPVFDGIAELSAALSGAKEASHG